MVRAAILMAVLTVACGGDNHRIDDAVIVDAPTDAAGSGSGSGSGSASVMAIETSPRDHNLEVMTGALGLVIILGPISLRRRRRTS